MGLVVDNRHKLDEPFMSDLQSTQPRPIKVMDSVSDSDGVVHANVGQKLLNCYPIKSFLGDQ
jgi:hypothetical protein